MKLSIFLPVYNEERVLKKNVNIVYKKASEITESFEIFIVDDSSEDKTKEIGKKLAKNKKIKYLRYDNGPTRRENLAYSFKYAKGDIICFMDIDLAVDIKHFPELIKAIDIDGYDIAIGSRYLKGSKIVRKLERRVISFVYHKTLQFYYKTKITDFQCGFKAFKKEVILDLIKKIGYDKTLKRGWFWDVELLVTAEKDGYKIKEIPITWIYGRKSSFSVLREVKMIPYVIKTRKRLFKRWAL